MADSEDDSPPSAAAPESSPSYDDLRRRVLELERQLAEFRGARDAALEEARRTDSLAREVEEMAHLGHWELDLESEDLRWSREIYAIFEIDHERFGATYEAFLAAVHPADREFVDSAYRSSLERKTGYDIVHRLLLADGRVKYVRERCKTVYDASGKPLRSLGTVQDITDEMQTRRGFAGIVGREPRMQEIFATIRQLADLRVPVLIHGETGTGKELVARALHAEGVRSAKPFVPVNCGALPEGLLESEIFGYVRGAFTGALRDKKGRFELADGGTLFLDEVGELSKALQVKLLRVLQEGRFERLGDEKPVSVDVRILSATNRDLREEVARGRFREDLYYRLKVVPLVLPPLRERRADVGLLAEHFLEMEAREGQRSKGLSTQALAMLVDYPWPGNVRELQSAIRFALIKAGGGTIEPDHLPQEIILDSESRTSRRSSGGPLRIGAPRPGPGTTAPEAGGRARGRPAKLDSRTVMEALAAAHGNKVKAAAILGVGRATLYRFLRLER